MNDAEQRAFRIQVARDVQPINRSDFRVSFNAVVRLIRASKADLTAFLVRETGKLDARITDKLAQIKDGKTPTKDELRALIRPLIPIVKDGETPSDSRLLGLIQPLVPVLPVIKDGDPGKDADEEAILTRLEQKLPQLGLAIIDALKFLPEGEKLPIQLFEGLDEELTNHVKKLFGSLDFGPGGGTSFALLQSGTEKVQQPIALNFTGAGAPTITHRQSGVTDLTFPGSGESITVEIPPEAADATTTQFTVSKEPKWMVADGVTYYEGAGYLYDTGTGTVTFDNAPSEYVRAII